MDPVTRREFILRFVRKSGVTYTVAAQIYDEMISTIADAVVTGRKICLGNVMALNPSKRKARCCRMNFKGTRRTIYLSERVVFKVRLHRKFLQTHSLQWAE